MGPLPEPGPAQLFGPGCIAWDVAPAHSGDLAAGPGPKASTGETRGGSRVEWSAVLDSGQRRAVIYVPGYPDLRQGNPEVRDLIAEIDEAIERGDEPLVEELSADLRALDPSAGAGSDT